MPVAVKCPQCSKGLKIPDKYRGKAIKCPACKAPLKVPSGQKKAATPKKRKPAMAAVPESDSDFLADLNFDSRTAVDTSVQICPKCAAEMADEEVVCAQCGHNLQTGTLDADVAKQRSRKGPPPNEFYGVAFKDGWAFTKKNWTLVNKTAIVWTLFGTLACVFSVIAAHCTRGPTIFFWSCLTGLATFAVAGWFWFLTGTAVTLTMEREDKIKRLNIDTFQTLALGIKAMVWPFVMGLPVWIVVVLAMVALDIEFLVPADIDGQIAALKEAGVPAASGNAEEVAELASGLQLQADSMLGRLRRLTPEAAGILGGTYALMYLLFPIAQIHLASKYTYKASVLWEMVKVVPRNFGPVFFWNLIALLLIAPIVGIFVLLELFVGGGNLFTNEYISSAGESIGMFTYNLCFGREDDSAFFYKTFRELSKVGMSAVGFAVIAYLAAMPAVILMRITGKFGFYNARNLGLVTRIAYGEKAGFWVRYVAFCIDLFCLPFANVIATAEKSFTMLMSLISVVFALSYFEVVAFLVPMKIPLSIGWLVLSAWMYFAVLESSTSRATIGKENMKLVAEQDGGKQKKLSHASLHFFFSLLTLPAFPITGMNSDKKSLGDKMAKCRVVWKGDG